MPDRFPRKAGQNGKGSKHRLGDAKKYREGMERIFGKGGKLKKKK